MRCVRAFLSVVFASAVFGGSPAFAEISAWFAPSSLKVLRDAKPNPEARSWELAAARNEVEACQLVLLSDQAVSGAAVSVSEFRLADGSATLPATLFRVAYVPNIVGETAYPDPLPPLGALDLPANQAQPVWISVKATKDAKPGLYAATVRVKAGDWQAEYPLQLRVWDFALPVTPSSATAFGIIQGHIEQQHGVAVGSPESHWLYAQYYEMLLDHRVSAYSIPADLMSDEAAKFLDDPRMTSYMISYPADDGALKALVARLKERGWYDKGYFYPIDEPVEKKAYDDLLKIYDRLYRCAPDYHWVVPFFRKSWDDKVSAFDLMANRVNIWCPKSQYFDADPATRSTLATRHRMGEKIWWYVCCDPGVPYSNFFVDMSAMNHRMLFWQQKRENVEGLLYWCTTWWNPASTKDPWTDMATVKDINKDLRGDGSLFYPGKQVGINGPVSSIRLEMIRDGLEDFDYLTLADAWLGKEKSNEFVGRLVRNLKDYEQDPLVLEKTRRELGDLLEKSRPADQAKAQ